MATSVPSSPTPTAITPAVSTPPATSASSAATPPEECFALNPKYKDGTRLRVSAGSNSDFNGVWVPNDTALTVLSWRHFDSHGEEVADRERARGLAGSSGENDWALVCKQGSGEEGWIRGRNLTSVHRASGVTRDVPHNSIVTPDPEYCKGMRIYGVGIKQDPLGGCKRGKGVQHLVSAFWVSDMAVFMAHNFSALQGVLLWCRACVCGVFVWCLFKSCTAILTATATLWVGVFFFFGGGMFVYFCVDGWVFLWV
jgi:hypothetical protein